ncbi:hypothetical protein HRD49_01545 [Corallococcus exiguus]|uniref:hypothetical protein n=1 Tax=Corallococcus exiguus TaxID=83462 RepID=UPI0015608D1A|nr:hypothetical protein [Corallococcus exiguus]NRD55074.1 hypothetical protein [Corallococcus exiguus]NRD60421.1 hypothetical protein [Corallococcus exiguus]
MRFMQIVWILVGAYLGPLVVLLPLRLLPEEWVRWLDVLEIPLGQSATLPAIRVLWLLSLLLGTVATLWAWKLRFEGRVGGRN